MDPRSAKFLYHAVEPNTSEDASNASFLRGMTALQRILEARRRKNKERRKRR
jgi:hypothetical protein